MTVKVFNVINDLQIYLTHGSVSDTYGEKTDDLLSLCTPELKKKFTKYYQCVFKLASDKLRKLCDNNTLLYKSLRLFDPAQLPHLLMAEDMPICDNIHGFKDDSKAVKDELHIYAETFRSELTASDYLEIFYTSLSEIFPILSKNAPYLIWTPISSVQCEQSFSQYKNLLTDERTSLTDENTKKNDDVIL